MKVALCIIAIFAILYAAVHRLATEGLVVYMAKKKYTPPNKKEIAECQNEVLTRWFKWYKPNK